MKGGVDLGGTIGAARLAKPSAREASSGASGR
jgi:hypothetical protein